MKPNDVKNLQHQAEQRSRNIPEYIRRIAQTRRDEFQKQGGFQAQAASPKQQRETAT